MAPKSLAQAATMSVFLNNSHSHLFKTLFFFYEDPEIRNVELQESVLRVYGKGFRHSSLLCCKADSLIVTATLVSDEFLLCSVPKSIERRALRIDISNNCQDFTSKGFYVSYSDPNNVVAPARTDGLDCRRKYGRCVVEKSDTLHWWALFSEDSQVGDIHKGSKILFFRGPAAGQVVTVLSYDSGKRIANISNDFGIVDSPNLADCHTFECNESYALPNEAAFAKPVDGLKWSEFLVLHESECTDISVLNFTLHSNAALGLVGDTASYYSPPSTRACLMDHLRLRVKDTMIISPRGNILTLGVEADFGNKPLVASENLEVLDADSHASYLVGVLQTTDVWLDSSTVKFTCQLFGVGNVSLHSPGVILWSIRTLEMEKHGSCPYDSELGICTGCSVQLEPFWFMNVKNVYDVARLTIQKGLNRVFVGTIKLHRPDFSRQRSSSFFQAVLRMHSGFYRPGDFLSVDVMLGGKSSDSMISGGSIAVTYNSNDISYCSECTKWHRCYKEFSVIIVNESSINISFMLMNAECRDDDENDLLALYPDHIHLSKIGFRILSSSFQPLRQFLSGELYQLYDPYNRSLISNSITAEVEGIFHKMYGTPLVFFEGEQSIKGIMAASSISTLFNLAAIMGPEKTLRTNLRVFAITSISIIDISPNPAIGTLTCYSSDSAVLQVSVGDDCQVFLNGSETAGSSNVYVLVSYHHPTFGIFSTKVWFEVLFPSKILIRSSASNIDSVVLRPIKGWLRDCSTESSLEFETAQVHVLALFCAFECRQMNHSLVFDHLEIQAYPPDLVYVSRGEINVHKSVNITSTRRADLNVRPYSPSLEVIPLIVLLNTSSHVVVHDLHVIMPIKIQTVISSHGLQGLRSIPLNVLVFSAKLLNIGDLAPVLVYARFSDGGSMKVTPKDGIRVSNFHSDFVIEYSENMEEIFVRRVNISKKPGTLLIDWTVCSRYIFSSGILIENHHYSDHSDIHVTFDLLSKNGDHVRFLARSATDALVFAEPPVPFRCRLGNITIHNGQERMKGMAHNDSRLLVDVHGETLRYERENGWLWVKEEKNESSARSETICIYVQIHVCLTFCRSVKIVSSVQLVLRGLSWPIPRNISCLKTVLRPIQTSNARSTGAALIESLQFNLSLVTEFPSEHWISHFWGEFQVSRGHFPYEVIFTVIDPENKSSIDYMGIGHRARLRVLPGKYTDREISVSACVIRVGDKKDRFCSLPFNINVIQRKTVAIRMIKISFPMILSGKMGEMFLMNFRADVGGDCDSQNKSVGSSRNFTAHSLCDQREYSCFWSFTDEHLALPESGLQGILSFSSSEPTVVSIDEMFGTVSLLRGNGERVDLLVFSSLGLVATTQIIVRVISPEILLLSNTSNQSSADLFRQALFVKFNAISLDSAKGKQLECTAGETSILEFTLKDESKTSCNLTFSDRFSIVTVLSICQNSPVSGGNYTSLQSLSQFQCSFNLTVSGIYHINIMVSGDRIPAESFDLLVQPAEVDSSQCFAAGSGIGLTTSVGKSTFEVITRDVFANINMSSGANLTFELLDHRWNNKAFRVFDYLTDNFNGSFAGEYTITASGKYRLSILLQNLEHIHGSPFTVHILPGIAQASTVFAVGDGIYGGLLGSSLSFIIFENDMFMNSRWQCSGADDYNIVHAGQADLGPIGIFRTKGKDEGCYAVTYVPKEIGTAFVYVYFRGLNISGSPYLIRIVSQHGAATAEHTAIENTNLEATAGCPGNSWCSQIDYYPELIPRDSLNLRVWSSGEHFATEWNSTDGNHSVAYVSDGRYYLQFTTTVAGIYSLQIRLMHLQIRNSPYSVIIHSAPAFANHSEILPPFPTKSIAGETGTVSYVLRDIFGNLILYRGTGMEKIEPAIEGHCANAQTSVIVREEMAQASWVAFVAGLCSFSLILHSDYFHPGHILGSPLNFNVVPGIICPETSIFRSAAITSSVSVGTPYSFIIEAKDQFGNSVSTYSHGLTFHVYLESVGVTETSAIFPACHGEISCSGHGVCKKSGGCLCEGNFDGSNCNICKPNWYGANCDLFSWPCEFCGLKGRCPAGKTLCDCMQNWAGPKCERCSIGFYGAECNIYCDEVLTCGGRGRCNEEGHCVMFLAIAETSSWIWDPPLLNGTFLLTVSGMYALNARYGICAFDVPNKDPCPGAKHIFASPFQITAGPGGVCAKESEVIHLPHSKNSDKIVRFYAIYRDCFGNRADLARSIGQMSVTFSGQSLKGHIWHDKTNMGLGFSVLPESGTFYLVVALEGIPFKGPPLVVKSAATLIQPVHALLVKNGAAIMVTFSGKISDEIMGLRYACDYFLEYISTRSLGAGCAANVKNKKTILISLGLHSVFYIGDKLIFRNRVLSNGKVGMDFVSATVNSVKVQGQPIDLSIFLSAPMVVCECDDIFIKVHYSPGAVRHKMQFEWNVSLQTNTYDNGTLALIRGHLLSQNHAKISSKMLANDTIYLFSVKLTSGSYVSNVASIEIMKSKDLIPSGTISGLDSALVQPDIPVLFYADFSQSSCGKQKDLVFIWTAFWISENGVGFKQLYSSSNSSRFLLKPQSLGWNTIYNITLDIYKSNSSNILGRSLVSFQTSQHWIHVIINGGSRTVSFLDSIVLEISISKPLSSAQKKTISWTCWPSPCFQNSNVIINSRQEYLQLPRRTLLPGTYKFSVAVTMTVGSSISVGQDSVWLFIVPGPVLEVSLFRSDTVRRSSTILLSACAHVENSVKNVTWMQMSGLPSDLTTSSHLKYYGLLDRDLFLPSLVYGYKYRFRMLAWSEVAIAVSEVSVGLADPPIRGSFAVHPATGFAADTEFRVLVEGWSDDFENLPLRYFVSYYPERENLGLVKEVPLGKFVDFNFPLRLPSPTKTSQVASLILKVINSNGASDNSDVSVELFAPPDPAVSAVVLEAEILHHASSDNPSAALRLIPVLNSLLGVSATARRRAVLGPEAQICSDNGSSCDNDGLRSRTLATVLNILAEVNELTCEELELAAHAVSSAVSSYINASTRVIAQECVLKILGVAQLIMKQDGSCKLHLIVENLLGSVSRILEAASLSRGYNSSAEMANANELVQQMINILFVSLPLNHTAFVLSTLQIKLVVAQLKQGSTSYVSVPLGSADEKMVVRFPSVMFANESALKVAAVHWRSGFVLCLVLQASDGSRPSFHAFAEPILVQIPRSDLQWSSQHSILDVCKIWPQGISLLSLGGTLMSVNTNETYVTCEIFGLVGISATQVHHSHGNVVSHTAASPFLHEVSPLWVVSRDFPATLWIFAVVFSSYLVILLCVWMWDYIELKMFRINVFHRVQNVGPSSERSAAVQQNKNSFFLLLLPDLDPTGHLARSFDYKMLKSLLLYRMNLALLPLLARFLALVGSDHLLFGILRKKLADHFTRSRRITTLFAVVLINMTANILVLSKGYYLSGPVDYNLLMTCGIVCSILTSPVGQFFMYLFKSVDSFATHRMRQRRRLKRVQESVVLVGAMNLLEKNPESVSDSIRNATVAEKIPKRIQLDSPINKPVDRKSSNQNNAIHVRFAGISTDSSSTQQHSAAVVPAPPPPPPPREGSAAFKRRSLSRQSAQTAVPQPSLTERSEGSKFANSTLVLESEQRFAGNTAIEKIEQKTSFDHLASVSHQQTLNSLLLSTNSTTASSLARSGYFCCSQKRSINRVQQLRYYVSCVPDSANPLKHMIQKKASRVGGFSLLKPIKTALSERQSIFLPAGIESQQAVCDRDGIGASSNPPVDVASVDEGSPALNPPIAADTAKQTLFSSSKATQKSGLKRQIKIGRPAYTTRAWLGDTNAARVLTQDLRGAQSAQSDGDGTWLQPLTTFHTSGEYLPRRLFGFPSDSSAIASQLTLIPGSQMTSRRARTASWIGHSKLDSIQETEAVVSFSGHGRRAPSTKTQGRKTYVETAQSENLPPKVKLNLVPKMPSLYGPNIAILVFWLVVAWSVLCLWSALGVESGGGVTLFYIWGFATTFGVLQDILLHQSLVVMAGATALGRKV